MIVENCFMRDRYVSRKKIKDDIRTDFRNPVLKKRIKFSSGEIMHQFVNIISVTLFRNNIYMQL